MQALAEHQLHLLQETLGCSQSGVRAVSKVIQERHNRNRWYVLDVASRGEVGQIIRLREALYARVVLQVTNLKQDLAIVDDVRNRLLVVRALQCDAQAAWCSSQRYDCFLALPQMAQFVPSDHATRTWRKRGLD